MRILAPAPQVLQITRFWQFSCHLLQDADGLTLIDTGLPGSAAGIEQAVKRMRGSIKRILITHAHNDHCGSLDRLVRDAPEVEVIASARTARLMKGDRTLVPDDGGRPLKGGYSICRTAPTCLIEDGDRVGGFRAIFTPGHAPGHVSYLHEKTGFLFTGDALHTAGGRLTVSGDLRLTFPFPYFATWDRGMALVSARRLSSLKPSAVFPAHGSALIDPATAFEEAIRYAEKAFVEHRSPEGVGAAP